MVFETLRWIGGIDGCLELIDQRLLPAELVYMQCRTPVQLYDAIRTLAVRGAPAIGVAAAYGVCIGMQTAPGDTEGAMQHLDATAAYLAESRPTAVNLFWALDRVKARGRRFLAENPVADRQTLAEALLNEAHAICAEDKAMCKAIGDHGRRLVAHDAGLLTHCNAGALATAGQGTALSPMYEAHKMGCKFRVYVDETRPLLQGARLTAWELTQAGIDATLICDNMAGVLMRQGKINAVITGADRIAANGDTANKIGTFSLSVLAAHHNIPFYIAAPSSTFDLSIENGDRIPIEQRAADEVACLGAQRTAPEKMNVYNPAFDVTPAAQITAIITEKGIVEKPNAEKIARHLHSGALPTR
ncbi:MAG: S-methyl-5-thioribose-1-phosphate isomerase [Phycisphaerae bacterium]|nr:S-methyl-5-thioribose-1-phosphate isomerase [Phycisphaerae bacterium]